MEANGGNHQKRNQIQFEFRSKTIQLISPIEWDSAQFQFNRMGWLYKI